MTSSAETYKARDLDPLLPRAGEEVAYNPDLYFILGDVDPHNFPGKEFVGEITRGIKLPDGSLNVAIDEGRDYYDLMLEHKMCDGFRDISGCNSRTPMHMPRVLELMESGRVNQFALGTQPMFKFFAQAADKANITVFEYLDLIYDTMAELTERFGCWRVRFDMIGEISNYVLWPDEGCPDKKAAADLFRKTFTTGMYTSLAWLRQMPEEGFSFYRNALERGGGTLRKLNISNTTTIPYDLHEGFQLGIPVAVYEAHAFQPLPQQICLAFTRGGARQHNGMWGVDNSAWSTFTRSPSLTTRLDEYVGGITPEAFLRAWVCQYLAGANFNMHESSDWYFFRERSPGVLVPSAYGRNAIDLYDFTRRRHPRRGEPVTPIALMLERDHGIGGDWRRTGTRMLGVDEGQWPGVFAGAVEMLPEDWMMYRLVEAAYPFGAEKMSPEWLYRLYNAHRGLDDEVQEEFERIYQAIVSGEEDARAYDHHLFDTTWGDCFDVIQENCSVDVLSRFHKVVVLVGGIKLDEGLTDRMKAYVAAGGTLVVSHRQISHWDAELLGIEAPTREGLHCRGWQEAGSKSICREDFYYAEAAAAGAQVLATDCHTGCPVAFEHTLGQGRAITVMADWMMSPGQRSLTQLGFKLIDRLHAEVYPVSVDGPPAHHMVNRLDDALVVTVMNNKTYPWRGTVRIKADALSGVDTSLIGDWWRNRPYDPAQLRKEGDEFVIDVVVRPSGFVVLGIGHEIVEEEHHTRAFVDEMVWGDEPDEKALEKICQSIADYRHDT